MGLDGAKIFTVLVFVLIYGKIIRYEQIRLIVDQDEAQKVRLSLGQLMLHQ